MKILKVAQMIQIFLYNLRKSFYRSDYPVSLFIRSIYFVLIFTCSLLQSMELASVQNSSSIVEVNTHHIDEKLQRASCSQDSFPKQLSSNKKSIVDSKFKKKYWASYCNSYSTAPRISVLYKDPDQIIRATSEAKLDIHSKIITYTVSSSIENADFSQLVFLDLRQNFPAGTILVPDSTYVNGLQYYSNPSINPNVSDGNGNISNQFALSLIGVGDSTVITFKVQLSDLTSLNTFNNSGSVEYGRNRTSLGDKYFSLVFIPNISAHLSLSQQTVNLDDIITYNLTITNNGDIDADSVTFQTILAPGITFIPDSLTINGTPRSIGNIANNIVIRSPASLASGGSIPIVFRARVSQIFPSFTNSFNVSYTDRFNNTPFSSQSNVVTISKNIDDDPSANPSEIIPAVTGFYGKIRKYKFLTTDKYCLKMIWNSSSSHIASYHIYYKKKLIAKIPARHTSAYKRYIPNASDIKHYSIVAYAKDGNKSKAAYIKICNK